MAKPLTLTKQATPDNLALFLSVVEMLGDRHDIPSAALVDLRLLVEEACTNVVLHAYEGRAPGEMTLRVGLEDDTAVLVVEDDGIEFDPAHAPQPSIGAAAEERREGGLGWHLIRTLSDEMHYEREGGRNRLTLRKRVPKG